MSLNYGFQFYWRETTKKKRKKKKTAVLLTQFSLGISRDIHKQYYLPPWVLSKTSSPCLFISYSFLSISITYVEFVLHTKFLNFRHTCGKGISNITVLTLFSSYEKLINEEIRLSLAVFLGKENGVCRIKSSTAMRRDTYIKINLEYTVSVLSSLLLQD